MAIVGTKTVTQIRTDRAQGGWTRQVWTTRFDLRATKGWIKDGKTDKRTDRVVGSFRPSGWKIGLEVVETFRRREANG